jgi:endo-1,4-beta-D-glucanase Y
MPRARGLQEFLLAGRQTESKFFIQPANLLGRPYAVAAVPAIVPALVVVQVGEQRHDPRIRRHELRQPQAVLVHPRPVRRTVDAAPVQPKGLLQMDEESSGRFVRHARKDRCVVRQTVSLWTRYYSLTRPAISATMHAEVPVLALRPLMLLSLACLGLACQPSQRVRVTQPRPAAPQVFAPTPHAPKPLPEVRMPFGAHAHPYAAGAHYPRVGQPALDTATTAFYELWAARYLVPACVADQLLVSANAGKAVPINPSGQAPGTLTTSEAHGYGMIIVALMAGHDPRARERFDALYRYYRAHPADDATHLMAWNQVTGCKDAPGDAGSATDGDLDIGFALLLADAQWGSAGAIDYRGAALALLSEALRLDVLDGSDLPSLGSDARDMETRYQHGTRTSDFMPDHFRAFALATGQARWQHVADASLDLATHVQQTFCPAGLLPDFIVQTQTAQPRPAPPHYLEGPHDGQYAWNACRVPWRLATDWLVTGDPRSLAIAQKLSGFFARHTRGQPKQIGEGISLAGKPLPDADGESLAFLAPLTVAALLPGSEQAWLDALWTELVARPLDADDYYGNTLKMLAMIVVSGNWPVSLAPIVH